MESCLVCVPRTTCVHVCAATPCFHNVPCMCLDPTRPVGGMDLFSFLPSAARFSTASQTSSFGRRCYKSSGGASTPLAGVLPPLITSSGICSALDASPCRSRPVSHAPSLRPQPPPVGAQCWDFLTFGTSLCLRSSMTPQEVHKLVKIYRKDGSPTQGWG